MNRLLSRRNIGILILVIGVLLVLGLTAQEKPVLLTENQGDCQPLYGSGKQTYYIQTDKPNNPQIMQVDVDPIDVKTGELQKITVKVMDNDSNTITSKSGISASIFTDNKTTAIASNAFKLAIAGDEQDDSSSLVTIWEGYWEKDDSTCQTYVARITAINDKGEESFITVTFK